LLGSALLAEQGNFDVLAVVLDSLDGPGEVVISGNQNAYVIIAFIAVGYHIGSQLDVGALFIRRDIGPVVSIDQASQTQFRIGYGVNSGKESLLLLVELGLLLLSHPGVIIIDSDELAPVYQFTAEFTDIQVGPVEVIFQRMIEVASVDEYHHPLPHISPPSSRYVE
jgi:hypothetical protein